MIVHKFKLVYDGLDAAENRMPQSFKNQIGEGMQRYVGAQLCYFVEGRLPNRVMGQTPYYRLHDVQERPACWIAEMDITANVAALAGGFILRDVVGGLVGDALKEYARDAVREFFKGCFAAWRDRLLIEHPPFERIEPVLSMPGANMPFVDDAAEQELQRRNLYRRMSDGMAHITSPIRRAATHVDVWFDDLHLDCIENRHYSDDEIESALHPLIGFHGEPAHYS